MKNRKDLEAEAAEVWMDLEITTTPADELAALADWAERIQQEAVAARDEEWETARGGDGGEGHCRDRIAYAVAEERKEARLDVAAELVAVVKRYGMDGSRIIQAITDALDARSKP